MDWIRAKIKGLRNQKGYSQEKMADLLKIEQTTYSNWETGKVDLTLKNISRIAEVLQVPAETIWDQKQFTEKGWKANDQLKSLVNEVTSSPYSKVKGKAMIPIEECEKLVSSLQDEIRKLKDENWALSRALNEFFDRRNTTTN